MSEFVIRRFLKWLSNIILIADDRQPNEKKMFSPSINSLLSISGIDLPMERYAIWVVKNTMTVIITIECFSVVKTSSNIAFKINEIVNDIPKNNNSNIGITGKIRIDPTKVV